MNYAKWIAGISCAALTCVSTVAMAQKAYDAGKGEYMANCSSCHGDAGKGNGPYVELLKKSPPDLTTLAKRNGGVFPINRVYEVIDGREVIKWHGTRDMPVWGSDYIASASNQMDVYFLPEASARMRILMLIDYLYRIQQK